MLIIYIAIVINESGIKNTDIIAIIEIIGTNISTINPIPDVFAILLNSSLKLSSFSFVFGIFKFLLFADFFAYLNNFLINLIFLII